MSGNDIYGTPVNVEDLDRLAQIQIYGMSPEKYEVFQKTTEDISANEYQCRAMFYEKDMNETYPRILNGLMGLNGEAGECIDLLKKTYFQGHPYDLKALVKELGDVAWYLALSADAIGVDLSYIFRMNLDKLAKRYPDGFDSEHSINRDPEDK